MTSHPPCSTRTLAAGAEVTAYVYDLSPEDPLAHDDIVMEYEGGILTRRWMHSDTVDEPVGFEEYTASSGVGSGTEHALYADRQGSVIWVTEPATGSVVAGYEYDGYGQITQTVGSLSQPYGYTGREYDAESGLYHYRARAYDPAAGVFVQSDPIEFASDTFNIHGAFSQDPLNLSDPTGLATATADELAVTGYGATAGGIATGEVYAGLTNVVRNILAVLRAVDLQNNLPATIPGEGTPEKEPPGNCDEDFQRKIQDEVDRLKKMPHSCNGQTAPFERLMRTSTASQLYFWRSFMNNICFEGGNLNHRTAARDAARARDICLGYP